MASNKTCSCRVNVGVDLTPEEACSKCLAYMDSSDFVVTVESVQIAHVDRDEMNEILCGSCLKKGNRTQSSGACLECREAMCSACMHNHTTHERTKRHVAVTMDQLNSNPRIRMEFEKRFICTKHSGKKITAYCSSHKIVCCLECWDIQHRSCGKFIDVASNATRLTQEIQPNQILVDLKDCEKRLEKCMEKYNAQLASLSAQVPDFLKQIQEMKNKINAFMDNLEKKVKSEGVSLLKTEEDRIKENILQCQNLCSVVGISRSALERVKENDGSDEQIFITACSLKKDLDDYNIQIKQQQQQQQKASTITFKLEIAPQMESILTQVKSLGKVICIMEGQDSPVITGAEVKKAPNPRDIVKTETVKISQPNTWLTWFKGTNIKGITSVMENHFLFTDRNNNRVVLLNSDYCYVSHLQLSYKPRDVCTTPLSAAVTLPENKQINTLEIVNKIISITATINTQYQCWGLSASNNGELVVCGETDKEGEYYWRVISSSGKEGPCHLIDGCPPFSDSYVTVDTELSRVYVSVCTSDIVVCHDFKGCELFRYKHDNLRGPRGVCHDDDGQVYVVGRISNNIHQLSPYGTNIRVLTDGVPRNPVTICLSDNNNRLTVAALKNNEVTVFMFQ